MASRVAGELKNEATKGTVSGLLPELSTEEEPQ
jgi:hypothetical protein